MEQDDDDQDRQHPLEIGLELGRELDARALVGLGEILIEAPAPLHDAEQQIHERADGQQEVAHKEVLAVEHVLTENGVENTRVYWPSEPDMHPQALEMLHRKEIDMVVNIPKNLTAGELDNGYRIRRAAIDLNIPLITNARLASAFINAFCTITPDDLAIRAWDEYK